MPSNEIIINKFGMLDCISCLSRTIESTMIIIMQGEMRFIIFSSYHSERRHHNFSLIAALIEIINDQQKRKKNKFLQISMSTVKQKNTSININLWGVKNEDDTNSQQSSWLHHVAPNRLDDVSIVMYAKEIELREMIITFEWKEHTHMYTQIEHRTTNWPDDHARNIN